MCFVILWVLPPSVRLGARSDTRLYVAMRPSSRPPLRTILPSLPPPRQHPSHYPTPSRSAGALLRPIFSTTWGSHTLFPTAARVPEKVRGSARFWRTTLTALGVPFSDDRFLISSAVRATLPSRQWLTTFNQRGTLRVAPCTLSYSDPNMTYTTTAHRTPSSSIRRL